MTRIIIFFSLFVLTTTGVSAQKIIRSSMSSFGNFVSESGATYRQTIGQPSSTTVFSNGGSTIRQGFQQPISRSKSGFMKEKKCSLHLTPNPTTDVVRITFSEQIGENTISVFDMMGKLQFQTTVATPYYELDVTNLLDGVYNVNVISKSGYYCSQKLVVIK